MSKKGRPAAACPRAVRIVGALMIVQALGLIGIGFVHTVATLAVPWISAQAVADLLARSPVNLLWAWERLVEIEKQVSDLNILFLPLGLMAFLAGVGMCGTKQGSVRPPVAWLAAMTVQGVQLFLSLLLYFTVKPGYVTVLMLYGVLMVLYLDYSEVADVFRPHRTPVWERPER